VEFSRLFTAIRDLLAMDEKRTRVASESWTGGLPSSQRKPRRPLTVGTILFGLVVFGIGFWLASSSLFHAFATGEIRTPRSSATVSSSDTIAFAACVAYWTILTLLGGFAVAGSLAMLSRKWKTRRPRQTRSSGSARDAASKSEG
jgi:hypothetical protein